MPLCGRQSLTVFLLTFISVSIAFAQGSPNVVLLDQLDSYSSYASCWGYTAPDGREYALIGAFNGTSIVDITDGPNSYEVDFISGSSSSWRELKTYRHYAYVVNESSGGMQIIDLSDLPNSASLAATYTGFTTAHTVYIDTAAAILYAEGTTSLPVRVISLANPLAPVQLTTFGTACHDMYAHNNKVYVSEGFQGTVGIYDVTNPSTPTLLRQVGIPASGYVHNCWTTEDDRYMMTTEETSGKTVKMWDIQDLNNVFVTDSYLSQPSNLAHNVHIKGDLAFIAHYGDGLRIVDISDPANIVEIGYYDTNSGTTGFVGAWGTYPYYASGKVIISDISNGLFIFQFDDGSGSPPVVSDIPDQTITLGGRFSPIRADNYVSDPDHTDPEITWTWSGNTSLIVTFITASRRIRVRAPNGWTGTETITFTATDPDGLSDSDPAVFKVNPLAGGTTQASGEDQYTTIAEIELDEATATEPAKTALIGNYPNPFNPSTTIRYTLAENSHVSLRIYNSLGQGVRTLVNGFETAGEHRSFWNGTSDEGIPVSSGLYYYRIVVGNQVISGKMLMMK